MTSAAHLFIFIYMFMTKGCCFEMQAALAASSLVFNHSSLLRYVLSGGILQPGVIFVLRSVFFFSPNLFPSLLPSKNELSPKADGGGCVSKLKKKKENSGTVLFISRDKK